VGNYPEQVSAADFGTRVAGVRAHLQTWSEETRQAVDAEDDDILERVELLLDEVLVVTAVQNESVVPRGLIGNLTNAMVAVDAALTALDGVDSSTVTVALVSDLTNAVETLASNLIQWPPRIDGENWREAVTQAASTYRRSAGQQLAGLNADIDGAKAELARIEQYSVDLANKTREIADEKATELEAQLTDLEAQITTTQATVKAASTQIQAAIDRSESAIGTQQQQFAEAQEERSKAFTEAQEERASAAKSNLAKRDAQALAIIQDLELRLEKATTLVEVFTAAGTANAYSREAKAQGRQPNIWRGVAIALGVLTAVAVALVLVEFPERTSLDAWQLAVGKLALGATVGAVAGYAARQSSRHRRREERAKHLELNLETFGSLASELSPDKLEDARSALVTTMLKEGEESPSSGRASKDSISDSQITILQRAFELFRSNQT
jgi:hypothetical protein